MKKHYFTILLLLLCSFSFAQNPIAHYNFNNSLNDETGNWNLSPSSGFTPIFETGQDGTANSAIAGFGAEDFLTTVDNFAPFNGSADRTVTAWVKLPIAAAGKNLAVLGLGNNDNNLEKFTFGTIAANSQTESRNRVEVKGNGKTGNVNLAVDTWVHIAITYTSVGSSTFKLYVNGVLDVEKTINNPINTGESALLIGNDYTLNGTTGLRERGWPGAIDDVRIFDTVLTEAQITAIYSSTLSTNNYTKKTVGIYPNPIKNHLFISNPNTHTVEIFDILGKLKLSVKEYNVNGIDTSNLSHGVYIIKVYDEQKSVLGTVKAIKN